MKVSCLEIVPLLQEALKTSGRARLTVTGNSMRPFIYSGETIELLIAAVDELKKGDVVLVEDSDGDYFLHRIIRKKGGVIYTRGDANLKEEGPFKTESVLAIVTGILRGNRIVKLDKGFYRICGRVWSESRVGSALLKVYDRLRRSAGGILSQNGHHRSVKILKEAGPSSIRIKETQTVLNGFIRAFVQRCPSGSIIPKGFDDWQGLQALADEGGVEGIFSDSICAINTQAPAEWVESIQQRYLERFTKNTIALHQLKDLAKAFDQADMDVMVFKGACFLLFLDKDPGYRELSDIDLLVRKNDISAVVDLMASIGYKPLFKHGKSVLGTDLYLIKSGRTGHLPQFIKKGQLPVEIHINALSGEGNWTIAEKDLWNNGVKIQIGKESIYRPSDVHSLIHGCSHYMKHEKTGEGGTLKWIVDVSLQMSALKEKINPDDFWMTAKRWGVVREVSESLSRASIIAGLEKTLFIPQAYFRASHPVKAQDNFFYFKTLLITGDLPTFRAKLSYLWQLMFPDRSHMEQWQNVRPGAWLGPHYFWRLIQIFGRLFKEIIT